MRALFGPFLAYFLTPAGLAVLGALDGSLIVFLPLGIDFALILLAARHPELFWLYPICATVGELIGSAVTYWIGDKVGEAGLAKLVKRAQLQRIQQRVSAAAAPMIAALAIIPPPFPFTAFVLTSGALGLAPWRFFTTLTLVRLCRFAIEAALAARYGRRILIWMESTTFDVIVGAFIALAIVGTAVSAVALYRNSRRGGKDARAQEVAFRPGP